LGVGLVLRSSELEVVGGGCAAFKPHQISSIASVHRDHDRLVLPCRKTGDWMSSMYKMPKAAEYRGDEGGVGEEEVL